MFTNRRKRLYIDSKVQGAVLWRLTLHWVAFLTAAVLAITVMHYFSTVPIRPGMSFGEHLTAAVSKHALLFLIVLALIPLFLRDTLRLTHRFVGPVLRIRRSLEELAKGGMVEPVKLRKGDYWEELAEMVNQVADRIRRLESDHGSPQSDWESTQAPSCDESDEHSTAPTEPVSV